MWLDERNEETNTLTLFTPEQRSSWGLPQCFEKDTWLDERNEETNIFRLEVLGNFPSALGKTCG